MRYFRKYYDADGPAELVEYHQPLKDRVRYLAAFAYDRFLPKRVSRAFDDVALSQHEAAGCNYDCATGYDQDGNTRPTCGFIPPSSRRDIHLYDLDIKNNTILYKYERQ